MPQLDLQTFLQSLSNQVSRLEVHMLRTRQVAMALFAESLLRQQGGTPRTTVEFTSQFGEDLLIWSLCDRQTNGFFIEAAANDGYLFSTTYGLEALGWNGLLVEAMPELYEQCAKRRKHSRVVNAALAPQGNAGGAPEQSRSEAPTPPSPLGSGGSEAGAGVSGEGEKPDRLLDARAGAVRSTTLNTLLAEYRGVIDAVLLHVGGDELKVLNGFNLQRFRPRILLIEDKDYGKNPALRNHMAQQGYTFGGRLAVNDIYIRNDEAAIFEQLKWQFL